MQINFIKLIKGGKKMQLFRKKMTETVQLPAEDKNMEEEIEREAVETARIQQTGPSSIVSQAPRQQARIIAAELLENGTFRTIILSNYSLGEAGRELS